MLPVSLFLEYHHISNIPISEISEYVKICISQILKFPKNNFDICIIVELFLFLHQKKSEICRKRNDVDVPSALFIFIQIVVAATFVVVVTTPEHPD